MPAPGPGGVTAWIGVDMDAVLPRSTGVAVRVTAPARLSFTLISLDGESLRRNGIASVAVERPGAAVEVRVARGSTVVGAEPETSAELLAAVNVLGRLWDGPPVEVRLASALPQHSGFGSKTTTLLALGAAYATLCGQDADPRELARLLGRGRTSGASTGLATHGGFLVDCGHRNPPDFRSDPRRYLKPSHFAEPVDPPTPVVRLDFPDWPIMILLANGSNVGGERELEWFRAITPIPPQESWRTSHLVFMGLVPSVAERDYDGFCATVDELTFTGHFKRAQVDLQGERMTGLLEAGRREPSIDAIAMSSMGPGCFAFARDRPAAAAWAERLRRRGEIRDYWFTTARNRGASTEILR